MSYNKFFKSFCFLFCLSVLCFLGFSFNKLNAFSYVETNNKFVFNNINENSDRNNNLYKNVINNEVLNKIDNYLSDAQKKAHFPAMSVTIVNKESVLLSKTYGDCISTSSPFLLGSVSKSFTALCIMQLVEQNKLSLNANLNQYLKNATDGDKITIKQLLNHTSGLGEHQNLTNYKIVTKQNEHKYANVNYSLLGKIIEKVSGISYEDYVTQNIFNPLKMINSATNYETSINNKLITGYQNWFGINIKTKPKFPNNDKAWIATSAGYLSASTADLGKYLQMYLRGGEGIISLESINAMFYDGVKVDSSIPYNYAMGWTNLKEPLTETVLRHSGLVETGMSTIYILPEREIGIAIAVNTNDYFVGKDLMDRTDWSLPLLIMGLEPNHIQTKEYVLHHLLYNFIYFIVFSFSVLPLCLLHLYKKKILKGKFYLKFSFILLLHLLLPLLILFLPQIFFATPLFVVCAFVPDMFTVIILSSCLLFVGGIIKSIILIKCRNKKI